MDTKIKEYNARQISLMEKKIEAYLSHRIKLIWLIDDLYALIYCIQEIPKDFLDSFIKAWSDLEIPYACAAADAEDDLYKGNQIPIEKYLSANRLERIQEGIQSIQMLIAVYKSSYLCDLDSDEIDL